MKRNVPELLAPAGSLDAVRAAVANGANAVYLGASRFNARDDGAQLSSEDLIKACAIAHQRGVRVYLTFNVLLKTEELADALEYLGECIDAGIDAAIVQDIGAIRIIRSVYPDLEIHGSTQMTVHDPSAAKVMQKLGVERIVLARENTLDDISSIRDAVPALGLETFVHGAICISYSGQCFMSGMISERSANRGSCAQSCRKDYALADSESGEVLDRGYLISAKDMAAHDHLDGIAEAGIGCLKIEGRKKKPEYVATVAGKYRSWLSELENNKFKVPRDEEIQPLVQIFSRGNTGGMYGGRAGRSYVTRSQPDNRGVDIGVVLGRDGRYLKVQTDTSLNEGDGLGFEAPEEGASASKGFSVSALEQLSNKGGKYVYRFLARTDVEIGWRVVRTSDAGLLRSAKESYSHVHIPDRTGLIRLDVQCFGSAGSPLKMIFTDGDNSVTVRSDIPLLKAQKRALDVEQLREQVGRLGDTNFVLGALSAEGLSEGCFIPVSALNRMRQDAVSRFSEIRQWSLSSELAERRIKISDALSSIDKGIDIARVEKFHLRASVFSVEDAREAAEAGATEIVFDPFIRHPSPPVSRIRKLRDELISSGIDFRIRTPVIVRPEDRKRIERWIGDGFPILTGHLGLLSELSNAGVDVCGDYALNVFNPHTAAFLFEHGAKRLTASVELTVDEIARLVSPWQGNGFDVFVWGRPEGMTTEHCVLSAAYDRVPTTCRDLCAVKHKNVNIKDPAGYSFPVATDSDCRNRILHSRPLDGSEFIGDLWQHGIRGFHMVFNTPGDPVSQVSSAYRSILDSLSKNEPVDISLARAIVGKEFTRGHFNRAV